MSWTRNLSRKIFGPYLGRMTTEQAIKYANISRMLYFFSMSSIALLVYKGYSTLDEKQKQLEKEQDSSERLDIIDRSETHKTLTQSGLRSGIAYTYVPGKGMVKEEYNRDSYPQNGCEKEKAAQEDKIPEVSEPTSPPTPTTPPDAKNEPKKTS